MKSLYFNRLSIRAKLTLPYVLLSLLIALGGGLIVTRLMLESVEQRFTNQLLESRKLASELMVDEEDRLLETLRLLVYTDGVPAAMRRRDQGRILELVYPATFNAGEDAVIVLDKFGVVIASMIRIENTNEYELTQINEKLSNKPFVARLVRKEVDGQGDKYSGVSGIEQDAYFFVSGPVTNEKDDFVGVILVGTSLNGVVERISSDTLARATIYDINFIPIISSFVDLPTPPDIDPKLVLMGKQEETWLRDVTVSSVAYTEALSAWEIRSNEDIGILGTALAKDFLVEAGQLTRLNVSLQILAAITAAILLGVILSGVITRPILKLKDAASEISRGNLDVSVDTAGDDEVAALAKSFNEMTKNLRRSEKSLIQAYDKTIEGWVKALELRDRETLGHTLRAAHMTMELARAMNVDKKDLQNIWRGVLLHDIGKMGIPDSILLKQGPLDAWERKIIERHPALAREMLSQIEFLRPCMDIPTYHHEKWDGTGYPNGLVGEEIPLVARLFAIVDVWDALTSDRPYRQSWSDQEALAHIKAESGRHFDPKVVKAFVGLVETGVFRKNDQKTVPSPYLVDELSKD